MGWYTSVSVFQPTTMLVGAYALVALIRGALATKKGKQNDTRNHTMGTVYNLNTKILCSIKTQ